MDLNDSFVSQKPKECKEDDNCDYAEAVFSRAIPVTEPDGLRVIVLGCRPHRFQNSMLNWIAVQSLSVLLC